MTVYVMSADDVCDEHYELCKSRFPKRYEKALSFHNENDTKLSIAVAYLLYTVVKLEEKDILIAENGKPYTSKYPVCFNASHSGCYAVLAVSQSEVGVDIEKAQKKNLVCARRVFTPQEKEWSDNDVTKFSVLWTLKESVMKALGKGFALPPGEFDVTPFLHGESIFVGDTELWAYTSIYDGYAVSVCTCEKPDNNFDGIDLVRVG